MQFVVTTIQVLIAFQSLLFSAFLLIGRSKLRANRFLAAFLLSLAIQLLSIVAMESGALGILGVLTASLGMVFGPLVFLYARGLLQHGARSPVLLLHFVPALTVLAAGVTGLGSGVLFAVLNHLSLASYLGLTIVSLWRLRDTGAVKDSLQARRASWILEIVLVGAAAFVADVVRFWAELGNITAYREQTRLLLFLLLLVLVTRVVAKALTQPELFLAGTKEYDEAAAKYAGSTLTAAEVEAHAERLLQILEGDRLYVDPGLTLERLAQAMNVSPRTLSQVLNSRLGKSFSEVVNSYRVQEVKRLLVDPERRDESILDLSLQAGFNSKSTFNEVFKKLTGLTPSEYRRLQG